MDRDLLNSALLKAHEDDAKDELVDLYTFAADLAEKEHDLDASCFYLTHAFVFALEQGHAKAYQLNKRLVKHNRSTLIPII
jgi:hypothetical protein